MGAHSHEGHHAPELKIPSADTYKLENAPELMKIKAKLEKQGLKDPWLRNYVWRYNPRFGTEGQRWRTMLFRGWRVGIAAFLITIGIEKALGIDYGHGHHEAHGEGEHH